MNSRWDNVRIAGMAAAVPTYVETNEIYLEAIGERRLKRQTRMTGVESRHINDKHQKTADLCLESAKAVLEKTGWNKDEIRVMVFVTQTPSVISPSTAFIIQKQLGLSKDCLVFDMNLGCSGFVAGLQVVSSLLQGCGENAKGLLLVGDMQRLERVNFGPEGQADQMLFGSSGTATGLEIAPNHAIAFMDKSDGSNFDAIIQRYDDSVRMDGEKVFNFSTSEVVEYLKEFCEKNEIRDADVDYYVFHQAQKFILENMAEIFGVSLDKVPMSLKNYGNTSSASIPLTICVHREQMQAKEKQNLLLCGFGVGLACSMSYLTLDTDVILPVIETDHINEF